MNVSFYYDYPAWKKDHSDIIKIVELETSLSNLNLVSFNRNPRNRTISQGLQIFIFETQSQINKLRRKNQEYYQSKIEIPPKSA